MATPGALNGTEVVLQLEVAGAYEVVGGVMTHAANFQTAIVEITNKSSGQWRELLDGQGIQSMDLSAEFTYTSEVNYQRLRGFSLDKSIQPYRIAYGASTEYYAFHGMIQSIGDTAPDGDRLTSSLALQSTGEVFLNPGPNTPCLLYTSPSPRDRTRSRMPSSA